jgi:hypothetical protein
LPLDLIFSGTVLAIESTFAADAPVVAVVGPLVSVLFAHPERARALVAANTAAMRHSFHRRS